MYRDPFEDRVFAKTKPFPLTKEQEKAISPIIATVEEERQQVFIIWCHWEWKNGNLPPIHSTGFGEREGSDRASS